MSESFDRFAPGTLWHAIVERTGMALSRGALHPIATETRTIEDHDVRFEVRVVSSLARKIAEGQGHWPIPARDGATTNPFQPYEDDLFVANISDTHLCLLNKYNVIEHHALVVTRAFEPQESLLTPADFEALLSCMAEFDALGFYNSGPVAGASQPHKHLQFVPLPLSTARPDFPVAALFGSPRHISEPMRLPRLPFAHSFAWLDPRPFASVTVQAAYIHTLYRKMLAECGLDAFDPRSHPYNWLATRRFMLLIPRRRERFENISVNALGFAGSFFVSSQESLEAISRIGPMEVLKQVTFDDRGEH